MKDIPKFALILFIVTSVAAGALSWVNQITLPKRIEQQKKVLNEGLVIILPGSENGSIITVEDSLMTYYKGFYEPDSTQLIGYGFISETRGYQSTIRTLIGLDTAGSILGIKILSQMETPGLGARCEEIRSGESTPWWQKQFKNLSIEKLAVIQDGGPIQSITGATITSRVITNSITQTGQNFLQLLKSDDPEINSQEY